MVDRLNCAIQKKNLGQIQCNLLLSPSKKASHKISKKHTYGGQPGILFNDCVEVLILAILMKLNCRIIRFLNKCVYSEIAKVV